MLRSHTFHTNRSRHRHTDTQTHRDTETQRHRHTHTHTHIYIYIYACTHTRTNAPAHTHLHTQTHKDNHRHIPHTHTPRGQENACLHVRTEFNQLPHPHFQVIFELFKNRCEHAGSKGMNFLSLLQLPLWSNARNRPHCGKRGSHDKKIGKKFLEAESGLWWTNLK